MQRALSKLTGYAIDATDGRIGTVSDVLFDDATWKVRWLVIDTGHCLMGRKVLIHPSAVGRIDDPTQCLSVALTRARIKDSHRYPARPAGVAADGGRAVRLLRLAPRLGRQLLRHGFHRFPVLLPPILRRFR